MSLETRREVIGKWARVLGLGVAAPLIAPEPVQAQNQKQEIVFENVFDGITTAQRSATLRNVGQFTHLLQVSFPLETMAVPGLSVEVQWSRDGVNWRSMGFPITAAPVLTNGVGDTDVVAYAVYYGVFRSLSVVSNNATGGPLMTVKYIGTTQFSVPFVTLEPDRWIF